ASAEIGRRHAGDPSERAVERSPRPEAGAVADHGGGQAGLPQHLLRALHLQLLEQALGAYAELPLHLQVEGHAGDTEQVGEPGDARGTLETTAEIDVVVDRCPERRHGPRKTGSEEVTISRRIARGSPASLAWPWAPRNSAPTRAACAGLRGGGRRGWCSTPGPAAPAVWPAGR